MSGSLAKACLRCGAEFGKRRRDSMKQWGDRSYCSKSCSNKSNGDKAVIPISEKFWRNVRRSDDGCWLWTGAEDGRGYGQLHESRRNGRLRKAHRLSWEMHAGPIPPGKVIMHVCDTPACVNPAHLRVGTQADNMRDCSEKGRTGPRLVQGEKNPSAKLNWMTVREIRAALMKGAKQSALAQKYGVDRSAISLIARGKHWKEVEAA